MASDNDQMMYFSICLPRNDLCTPEPNTIIYSSSHRPAVHEAKINSLPNGDPSKLSPIPTLPYPPSKRSLAPMTEVQEFIKSFRSIQMCHGDIESANPQPNRPTSSSSQTHTDDDRLTRTSYNVSLHGPGFLVKSARAKILHHLRLHVLRPC
jgi:hypothetical protein